MNLGMLTTHNEAFVNDYKSHGFKTKTQMANEAFNLLRLSLKKNERADWRAQAFQELAGSTPDIAFAEMEGEDFEGQHR